jgi:hypothetical protein
MLLASNAQDNERAAVAQRYKMDQASSKIADEVTALSDQAREYVITGAASIFPCTAVQVRNWVP